MRTIDALPIANAAPLVDETQRRRMLGNAITTLGFIVNIAVLGVLFAAMFDAIPRAVAPIALPGIVLGAGLTAWGNRMRRRNAA